MGMAYRLLYESLANRFGPTCHVCGLPVNLDCRKGGERPSVDHLIPLREGGPNTLENARICHIGCNSRRWNRRPRSR